MDIIRFEHPFFLYALAFVPLAFLVHYLHNRKKRRALNRYADQSLQPLLAPQASIKRSNTKHTVLILAIASLIVALANPQVGSRMEKATRKGVDLVIALDVSNSMLAEDIRPNRLDNAKMAVQQLINTLEGDRIGLIIFAGKAYTQLPITTDYTAAKMFLNSVSTDIVPTQGTAIGDAIQKAAEAFPKKSKNQKALILISDGESHDKQAVEMARQVAKEQNIIIHTIGMGSLKGAPIPVNTGSGTGAYKKDKHGNTVISQLNQKMLKDIAKAGQGSFILANNTRAGVKALYNKIDEMEQSDIETKIYADYEDRFQYFLALAILLLILENLMFDRKNPWLAKWNFLNEPKKKP
ncbi:MAG: VWA domain-containing protein [Bacteroidales bacterium]